jgi:hypothetical protein
MTPTPEEIATQLTPPQRVLLFCVASGTEWSRKCFVSDVLRGHAEA